MHLKKKNDLIFEIGRTPKKKVELTKVDKGLSILIISWNPMRCKVLRGVISHGGPKAQ